MISIAPPKIQTLTLALTLLGSPLLGAQTVAPSAPDGDGFAGPYDREYQALREERSRWLELGRPALSSQDAQSPMLPAGDAVRNLDSGLLYTGLQAAINAATAGDTLEVIVDQLNEGPVTIDRDLFIQGAEGDEVIRPIQDTGSAGDARAWFLIDAGVALTVRDLTFDGAGFAIFQAFRHRGFGLFERVTFRNIEYEPSGPSYAGTAVVAFGDRVDIAFSRFEQIGRVGALYFGSSVSGSVFRANAYVGKGDGDFLDYGVELNNGALAWVLENEIRNCRGIAAGDGSASGAVLATTFSGPGTGLVAEGNNIEANRFGLIQGFAGGADTTLISASFNRLVNNGDGVLVSSNQPMMAENNWWGCNDGPNTPSCDTATTTDAGTFDADPWLVLSLNPIPWLKPDAFQAISGTLTRNSDNQETGGDFPWELVPDGIVGRFATAPFGTVTPRDDLSSFGVFASLLLTDDQEGGTQVDLTVDQQTVGQVVSIDMGLFCDGFESGNPGAWASAVP